MIRKTLKRCRVAAGAAVLGAMLLPFGASAQSDLDASQASEFMGNWVVDIESDFGPFTMDMDIEDQGGKVAATLGSPDLGEQSITDISREDESLVMTFEADAQGQFIEITITLEREGDDLAVWLEAGGGEFAAGGVATRQGE